MEEAKAIAKAQERARIAEYVRTCSIGLPLDAWQGTKQELVRRFALALADAIEDGATNKAYLAGERTT